VTVGSERKFAGRYCASPNLRRVTLLHRAATSPHRQGAMMSESTIERRGKSSASSTAAAGLPPSRTMVVHSADGTRLHTEVFGPVEGYPIVLAHGITCSIHAWHEQIHDLSRDFRVIAYDHRGHGRSGVPAASAYSLDHLPLTSTRCSPRRFARTSAPLSPAIPWAGSPSTPGLTGSAIASNSAPTPSR